jgi:radical SAM domain protein
MTVSQRGDFRLDTSRQFYFQWHFLSSCNLRCKHCYQDTYTAGELQFDKLLSIADKIIEALTKWNMYGRISLTGGEPFLSKNLFPLVKYLNQSDRIVSIDILTNGTLITRDDIVELQKIDKLHQVQISLDGGDDATHNSVRGDGAFQKAVSSIRLLKKAGIEVALMFTLMRRNKDGYRSVIEFANRENVDALTIERVTPCGNSNMDDLLTKDEIKDIYTDVTHIANDLKNDLAIRRARPLWINTACENTRSDAIIGGFCPVGLTALAILWDGTILPCRRLEIPLGNILTDGIFKVWYDSDILWKIRNKDNLKGKCHGCEQLAYCGGCRAIAYAVTGDYMGSDVQCWL